jgi:hypothetical protein
MRTAKSHERNVSIYLLAYHNSDGMPTVPERALRHSQSNLEYDDMQKVCLDVRVLDLDPLVPYFRPSPAPLDVR